MNPDDGKPDRHPRPDGGPDGAQRRVAFRFGLSAESRAAAFLVAKGYRIVPEGDVSALEKE